MSDTAWDTGRPAPWFRVAALNGRPDFSFSTTAGRHSVLLFFGSAGADEGAAALLLVAENRALFDDIGACFFGVTIDGDDVAQQRIHPDIPGIRFFLDFDRRVSCLYGSCSSRSSASYRCQWFVLDPMLRVLGRFPLEKGREAMALLRAALFEASGPDWAPVLMIPNVLPRELCRELIACYERDGGHESGFMREQEGKTVRVLDAAHKRRQDCRIDQLQMRGILLRHLELKLAPMVERVFQFRPTRIERYIVGCYDASCGGHFRPHRDNTTKGTEHRRFAVTVNLNTEDYAGGDLRFPEFGARTYRAPTGGAVVFSCSLLHEATRVTQGRRYAFLPFLYDEEAARVREDNNAYLGPEVDAYRAA